MGRKRTIRLYSLVMLFVLLVSPLSPLLTLNPYFDNVRGEQILFPTGRVLGTELEGKLGWNVSWVGDVNGDGFDDIVAGAPYADGFAGDWWNQNWNYRMKLGFDNSGQIEDLENFPVLVNLSSLNFNYSKAEPEGDDLRFIDADHKTELNYHIEHWSPTSNCYIWVNVTDIKGGSSFDHIWMYYGNPLASHAQNIEGTYDNNFVGVWHLNETSGTHYDATNNNNDGSPQNGVLQNYQGKVDGADAFDGTDDLVNCGTSASLLVTTAITIEALVKPLNIDNPGNDQNIVNKFRSDAQSYLLSMDDDPGDADDWDFKLSSNGTFPDGEVHASDAVDRNQWQYMVGTWNGTTMLLYKNANVIGSNDTFKGPIYQSILELWIGDGQYYDAFQGIIDEVRISNISRSADWITAQYLNMENNFTTYGAEEARNWWNFDWGYRRKLTFHNSAQSEDLTDFPVLVALTTSNFDYLKTKGDGTDLRFIARDGITELAYHIEDWDPAGNSYIWVNVTQIEGSSNTDFIYMYYDNPAAPDVLDAKRSYNSNYIGVWHLNETSGYLIDSSSNSNDGSAAGGLTYNAVGRIHGAVGFDGVDDHIDLDPFSLENYTIDFWFKGNGTIIGYEEVTMKDSVDLRTESADSTIYGERGEDRVGYDVSSGDINADGINDTIVGSMGSVYIIYGQVLQSNPDIVDLNSISANITIHGDAHDRFGMSVEAGDFNNDGFDDILIGAFQLDHANGFDAGGVFVIYGADYVSGTIIDLNSESANITVIGEGQNDNTGLALASGDINKDGIDDMIIGAHWADPGSRSNAGVTYVIYGANYASGTTIDLNSVNADLTIYGDDPNDSSGRALASGDVNNDGYDDVIIGAFTANTAGGNESGETYVIYGADYASGSLIDLDSVAANITIFGDDDGDFSGHAVASGDVNNDGYDDVIIGAYLADPAGGSNAGETYVIYGGGYTQATTIDLNSVAANLTVYGDDINELSGFEVSSGDINNDGFYEVIIGAYGADPNGRSDAGKVYVIYGADYSTGSSIDLNSSSANLSIYGDDASDLMGYSVTAGDMNNDGWDDLITGAFGADPPGGFGAGEAYVIYGADLASGSIIDLETVSANISILGNNSRDSLGRDISSGDINNDGYEDLIISAYAADTTGGVNAGKTYIFYGHGGFTSEIDLVWKSADITIYGDDAGDLSGYSVSSGDFNYDGYDDVLLGAYWADPGGRTLAGEAYVVYGSEFASGTTIDLNSVSADISIYGDNIGDNFGKKVHFGDINNDGFDDVIIGATYADAPAGSNEGAVYVIFGADYASGTTFDMSIGSANLTIFGNKSNDYFGEALSAGDINNDGFDDIIIGAYGADPAGGDMAGETYVIFGADYAPASTIELKNVEANLTVYGDDENDFSGFDVAAADINDDGFDDVIIGAYGADPVGGTGAGEAYVIFGEDYAPGSTIDLNLVPANISILGNDSSDQLGYSLAAGDVNNDGINDLVIGAQRADPMYGNQNGETYVIYGRDYPSGTIIDLNNLSADITISGNDTADRSGSEVHALDYNNDGFFDLVIGAYEADYKDRFESGEVYILNPLSSAGIIRVESVDSKIRTVFSHSRNTSSTFSDVIDTGSWHHVTVTKGDVLRLYVDGILEGFTGVNPGSISGPLNLTIGALNHNGSLHKYLSGTIDELKILTAVKSPDWINAQHLSMTDNFISFGAETTSPPVTGNLSDSGTVYVFFGHPEISLSNINISEADVTISGGYPNDLLGWSVAGGMDVNNDGYDDIILGAPGWNNNKGRAYIFHGRRSWNSWYSSNDANTVLTGENSGDMFGSSVSNLGKTDEKTIPFKGWEYRKSIKINAIQVEDDLTDFPLMINILDIDLKDKARLDGNDIFFADPESERRLDHEIEHYDGSTGNLVAWVRMPYLSSSSNTTIDMYYGNGGQSTPMENPKAVWDSDYIGVWHLNDDFDDSTRFGHNGNNKGSQDIGAIIANGQDFEYDDSTDGIDVGNWNVQGQGLTLQAWVNFESFASDGRVISKAENDNIDDHTWMLSERNDTIRLRVRTTSTYEVEAKDYSLSTSQWYFIMGTYDGSMMRLRLDKTEVNSTTLSGDIAQDLRGIAIGNQPQGNLKPFDGIIDEVRVSSIRRSDAWLNTEYNNQKNPQTFYSTGEEMDNSAIWQYRKTITPLASQVSGDLTDFPLMISLIDPDLRNRARADGNDILFLDSDKSTLLDYEIESYNSLTSELVAWIRVPYLSLSSDTLIYMYYGNKVQTISMENPHGVWKNGYVGVYHMTEETGDIDNSASSYNDGTRVDTPTRTQGRIGYGQNFTGGLGDDGFILGDLGLTDGVQENLTMSFWLNTDNASLDDWGRVILKRDETDTNTLWGAYFDDDVITERDLMFLAAGDTGANTIANSIWVYVSFTYDGSTKVHYHNGSWVRDDTGGSGPISATVSSAPVTIGTRVDGTQNYAGILDEVRISKVKHSADWIQTEYNNQYDPGSFYDVGLEEHLFSTMDDDVAVGAHRYDNNRGRVYVLNVCSGTSGEILAASANSTITGSWLGDCFGWDISYAGDLNNDSYPDMIIGAPANHTNPGLAFIFHNLSSMGSALDSLDADVIVVGESKGDEFGFSVAGSGDLNNDGFDDVIIGAPQYESPTGDFTDLWGSSDIRLSQNRSIYNKLSPEIAVDSEGNTIVVWQDARAGDWDIYAQKIDLFGTALWGPSDVKVNQNISAESQSVPSICIDSDDNAIIVWEDYRDGSDFDIYAQKLDPLGTALWGSDDVLVNQYSNTNSCRIPDVDVDSGGNVIVVWDEYRSNTNVYAQKLDPSGNPVWSSSDVQVNQNSDTATQRNARIAVDSVGNSIVVWRDLRDDNDIYAQKLDSAGSALWGSSDIKVNQYTSSAVQWYPDVDVDPNGNSIVVWEDQRNGASNASIYAQNLSTSGVAQWSSQDVLVNQNKDSANRFSPKVAVDSNANSVVVWWDFRNGGTNEDIYAQRLDRIGNVMWGSNDKKVNQNTDTVDQGRPDVDVDPTGHPIFAWCDKRNSGSYGEEIYTQKLGLEKTGAAYIYYGSDSMDNMPDVKLVGENHGDRFGFSVGSAGDLDQDTVFEVMVGAPYYDNGTQTDSGAVYVFSGGPAMDAYVDWTSKGLFADEHFGWSISGSRDIDGSGWPYLVVGAPGNSETALGSGKIYILQPLGSNPVISNIIASPITQFKEGFINISCMVLASSGLNSVWVNISLPGGGSVNTSMTPGSGDEFYYNNNYSLVGIHQYTIWAEDIFGNLTQSPVNGFEILGGAPSLSLPSVDPVSGYIITDFNFTAVYTDPSNNPPVVFTVNISGPSHSGSWDMMEVDPGDLDHTDGKSYYYSHTGFSLGSYSFHFAANDSLGNWIESTTLVFDVLDGSPSLSSQQVNPTSGYNITGFNFTVIYTSPMDLAPNKITLNISGEGNHDLLPVDPLDLDYTDGKLFYQNLSGFGLGSYNFHFAANDTLGDWVESPTLVFDVLDGSPLLSSEQVTPSTGYIITVFNFTVTYTSPLDYAPSVIKLNITGEGNYGLLPVDPLDLDHTDGKQYFLNLSGFSVGTYNFHMAAEDSNGGWAETGSSSFDVLSGEPALSSEQVTPNSGYVDSYLNFHVIYTSPMNLPPDTITVNITGYGIFDLLEVDPLDLDYTDGKEYEIDLSGFPVGNYAFHFAANDTMGTWTETGTLYFDIINRAPSLSSPQVAPNSGNLSSGFNFTVTYSDPDNHPPDSITVNITGYGTFDLLELDPLDMDHTDGKDYYYNATGFTLGSFTFKFAANDTKGAWVETGLLGFDVTNRPPSLSSPQVNPTSGFVGSDFNFTVVYTDLDDHPPGKITVNISGFGTYDLIESDVLDEDFTDGKEYYFLMTGFSLGSHSFHFSANDTQGEWVESNVLGFDVINQVPALSAPQVDPQIGYLDSIYNFTVIYTDLDNQLPSNIMVNISSLGSYPLTEVDFGDLDCNDGKFYYFEINGIPLGLHPFNFAACDTQGAWVETSPSQFDVINRVPSLSFGGVTPTIGFFNSSYNFTVTYLDPDNDAPTAVFVNLTGIGHYVMMEVDPLDTDYSDGKLFYFNISQLPVGSHSFHFAANDSKGFWANETQEISGPEVLAVDAFLTIIDFAAEFSDDINIIATLLDHNYQPVANEHIILYIDLDDNGIYEPWEMVGMNQTAINGSIDIKYSGLLVPGTWRYSAFYNGSMNYLVADEEAEITIIPKPATLMAISEDVEDGDTTELQALLLDEDGNRIGNELVAFYIDLKQNDIFEVSDLISSTYTSSEGVATITYTVDLAPGDYGFYTKYVGSGNYSVNEITGLLSVYNSTNRPPMILWPVPHQTRTEDSPPWTLDLTPYEVDLEDSGSDLNWYITGVDPELYTVTGMNSTDDVFTFIPHHDAYGNDETTLWLVDSNGNRISQTLWINITPLNDPPYFNPLPPNLYVHYDDPGISDDDPSPFDYTFYVHDTETPVENLVLTTSAPTVDSGQGRAVVDGLSVSFHYPEDMVGDTIMVTLTISDGIDKADTVITVIITTDWVPELVAKIPDIVIHENSTLYNAFDLDDHFTDRDHNSLFFSSGTFNIDVTINENNTVDITSLGEWTGSELITFRAMDPLGAIVEDTIRVTVIPINDGPQISGVPDLVVHYDYSYAFDLTQYIHDPDNHTFELVLSSSELTDYIWVQSTNNLGLVINYPQQFNGMTIPVTIHVTDGMEWDSQQIQISVTDDFPPELTKELPDVVFTEDTEIINAFILSNYFYDFDGDLLFYTAGNRFVNVTINPDFSVDFSAPLNWYGSEMVTFRAKDPHGAIAEDRVMVVVVPVNDAPVIGAIPKQERKSGEEWTLDISKYIYDVDNEGSELSMEITSDEGQGSVKLVGNVIVFSYPKGIYEDIITVTVSDGEQETTRSFIVTIQRPESVAPTFWDLIPWVWVMAIIIISLLCTILFLRRHNKFHVYEVFLIHDKGLPLAHASQKETSELEEVVVSGMFTAVQDFISDAFAGKTDDDEWELDEMKFGENKILIEREENLFLAVIFGGNGDKLRIHVKRLLAEISSEFSSVLTDWDGDMSKLKGLRAMTMGLLSKKPKTKDKKKKGSKEPKMEEKVQEKAPEVPEKEEMMGPSENIDRLDSAIHEVEALVHDSGLQPRSDIHPDSPKGLDNLGPKLEITGGDCPVCGANYTFTDNSCNICGTEFGRLKRMFEELQDEIPRCPSCSTQMEKGAHICLVCGQDIRGTKKKVAVFECPECGATVKETARFCSDCGVEFID